MRQCSQCNRMYPADTAYCLEDGSLLNDVQSPEATLVKTTRMVFPTETETAWRYKSQQQPKRRRNRRTLVTTVLAIIVAGVSATLLILNSNKRQEISAT